MRLSYNDSQLFPTLAPRFPASYLCSTQSNTPGGNEAKHRSTVVTCTAGKDEKLKKWVKAPLRPSTVPWPLC